MAILVHHAQRPPAVSTVSGNGAVFSYGEEGEDVEEDPAAYVKKWPSLSLDGAEQKKEDVSPGSGRLGGSVSKKGGGHTPTPIQMKEVGARGSSGRVGVVQRGVEGVADEEKSDVSSSDVSTSEEGLSEGEDEGDMKGSTTSTIPMPRFQ